MSCINSKFISSGSFQFKFIYVFVLLFLMQDEYAQKTGLVSKALSFSDEQKKEVLLYSHIICICCFMFLIVLPNVSYGYFI